VHRSRGLRKDGARGVNDDLIGNWPLQEIRLLIQGLRTNQYYCWRYMHLLHCPPLYLAIDIGQYMDSPQARVNPKG